MFAKFMRDPYYMLKYHLVAGAIFAGGCAIFWHPLPWPFLAGLVLFAVPNFWLMLAAVFYYAACFWVFHGAPTWQLLLIPAALAGAIFFEPLMHNAAHGNFKPRWLNPLVGEICGVAQLSSFAVWQITHLMHHGHPDDPELDVHPPGQLSFLGFLGLMILLMFKALQKKHYKLWGTTPRSILLWNVGSVVILAGRVSCALLILLLIGPVWFAFFYLPMNVFNILLYADFNYRTHRPAGDGFEILDLNETPLDRFLNRISHGSYFHKSHHRNPRVFNPRNVPAEM
jgi:fatty acid desaturase